MLLSPGSSQPKSPTLINSFPNFLLPDARAESFLRGGSLEVNTPSATKPSDGGGHWPAGSQLLCGVVVNCTHRCLDPQNRAGAMAFWSHSPLSPALQNRLSPKFLQCSQICVGLFNVSCKGQGKQKGRSDSNYLMH